MSEEITHNQSNLTQSLFWESCAPDMRSIYNPQFTLKLREHKGLPSAYEVYLDAVTEDEAALLICEILHHWDKLIKSKWFMEGGIHPGQGHLGLKTWREHKERKETADIAKVLKKEAKGGSIAAANAYLKLIQSKKTAVGRPDKPTAGEDGQLDLEESLAEYEENIKNLTKVKNG